MRLLTAFLVCATFCAAAPNGEPKVELGEINGAKFRIDIPPNWNGGLVMYCHGYSPDRRQLQGGGAESSPGRLHCPRLRARAIRIRCRWLGHSGSDPGHRGAAEVLRHEVRPAQGDLYHRTFHGWISHHDIHGALPHQLRRRPGALRTAGANHLFHGTRRVRRSRGVRLLFPGRASAPGQSSSRLPEYETGIRATSGRHRCLAPEGCRAATLLRRA